MRSAIHPDQADSHKIVPRRMDFAFDDAIPRFWFDGDPFKSMLLTALSCTFPEGERFFIHSVRYYQTASPIRNCWARTRFYRTGGASRQGT